MSFKYYHIMNQNYFAQQNVSDLCCFFVFLFFLFVFFKYNQRPYTSGANKAITMTWKNWFPKYLNSYFSKLSCRLSEPLSRNESGRFGTLKSDSTHHFFRNACKKSGSLRFSQFSGC